MQTVNSIRYIRTATTLDHETKDTYSVTWNVSDGKDAAGFSDSSADASVTVTISVNNLDEPGTLTLSGTEEGGSTLTATLTDLDGTTSSHVWNWTRSATEDGAFTSISGATSSTYTLVAADVDHWLKAVVQYTDPHGPNKAEFASTGQIGGSNVKPTFDEAAPVQRFVPENSAVGTRGRDRADGLGRRRGHADLLPGRHGRVVLQH